MAELPKPSRRLTDLAAFFGAPDEIAPVNRHLFGRKVGELIARARAKVQARYGASAQRKRKPSENPNEGGE